VGGRWVQPFDVAPWAEEKVKPSTPEMLRVMRGDFFCMPFGGSEVSYRGEVYPPHGETANGVWKMESLGADEIHLSMKTSIRRGRVDKYIRLAPLEALVYCRHIVSGMKGPMCLGHHAILKLPAGASGRVSVSPFRFGMVYPGNFEDPAKGGYSSLKPGARFTSLSRVPLANGGWTDLSVYPAREGFEDLALLATKPTQPFAWTAMTVSSERYVWFALKDPRVLVSTVFWMSNGGRHYAPWNGRHRRAIGLEEVVGSFHNGLAESARENILTKADVKTCAQLVATRPLVVNYIMGMAAIGRGFDVVERIEADGKGVKIAARSGQVVNVRVDIDFLKRSMG